MKRFLAAILALVLVLSVSAAAYAAGGSVQAAPAVEAGNKTTALPTVVNSDATLVSIDNIADLPEEAQKVFKEASESVKKEVPDGMVARYFFYSESKSYPYELKINMDDIKDVKDLASKLFLDGKWVDLKLVLNKDGTVSITVTGEGPMAVFTKK